MPLISRADAKAAGLKRYFTGEPCVCGHIVERRVSDYGCIECSRLKARNPKERERRRGYMAEHQRNYRRNHPDRIQATELKRDKIQRAAARRDSRSSGREDYKKVLSRSFQKHKIKRMAESRAWRENNREEWRLLMRVAKARRRAAEVSAEGSYTRQDVERLWFAQQGLCAGCACDITDGYHIDHIVPLSRGGTNWPGNIQLMCQPCNQSKGDKTMLEWIDRWIETRITWRVSPASLCRAACMPRPSRSASDAWHEAG